MIITKQKPIEQILEFLKGAKNIFLVGCAQCATVCKTGGEEQLDQMQSLLKRHKKKITGKVILDPPCHLVKAKQFFQNNKGELSKSDALLAMTCGDGVQSVMEGTRGLEVYPALDALFLGKVERGGIFSENCTICGECVLNDTGSICPLTICSKGLLNGPCGGSKGGKCEVDRERDCGWLMIYRRLKDTGQLEKMKTIKSPRDYSKRIKPQRRNLEKH